jgi:hypothetical protein
VVVDGLDKLKDGAKVEAIDPKAVDAPGRESRGGAGRPGREVIAGARLRRGGGAGRAAPFLPP